MNSRGRSVFYIFIIAGILICISLFTLQIPPAFAQDPVPTPTYDPLAQPELPPNPTELEMGRYLFWRHCMPCHGDVGQGLTDDFRVLWEEHQNCWERGCHSGKQGDEGFPIPTVIPAIVTEDHLSQFTSEEELSEYLKATHPPQHPGYLEYKEYHDIAVILFKMNNRSPDENIAVPTSSPVPTFTLAPTFTATPLTTQSNMDAQSNAPLLVIGLNVVLFAVITFWVLQKFRRKGD
jgi:hypothetical protein